MRILSITTMTCTCTTMATGHETFFKLNAQTYQAQMKYCWASSRDFSTHHTGDQRML